MSQGLLPLLGEHESIIDRSFDISEQVHAPPPPGHSAETLAPLVQVPMHAHDPFGPSLHVVV